MKVMISVPNNNIDLDLYNEVADILEKEGHEVVESTINEDVPQGLNADIWFLSKAIEKMAEVDGVIFLQELLNYKKCKLEYQVAKQYRKFIRIM